MDDENIAIISAVVAQQNIFLHQLIMLINDDDDDDFNFDEDEMLDWVTAIKIQKPGRLWSFRIGTFWEKEVPENNEAFFKESFRMERPCFDILVNRLEVLRKKDTNCRAAIPLEKRIAIALYTLGSSSEYRTVGRLFGVAPNSVCNILHEFCRALIHEFSKEYMSPNYLTSDKIDECVKGFEAIGFPQCLGAIDGCHIEIKPPAAEAVDHHNSKGWYSTVLFALVDYRYRFTYVNIGSAGRCNDSMIYQKSSLAKHIEASALLQEKAKEISGVNVPVMLIGDSAFRFSKKLMKPYPFSPVASLEQRTFNYNLSKARRVVENAFGHLKARFRIIGKGLGSHHKNNSAIIMSCCILHNILNMHNSAINENWELATNDQREQPDTSNSSADFNQSAEQIRSAIAKYCVDRNEN
ncbi:protein ALP1-like isoform X2 [Drosophila pseudoobscura]|uniref:Protein ALP1-like isoform X2 n=1 Tax=Drosophila pseudoobscura pseudoobscura TaxID=46245 RepID=A0A6I8W603_DROPS|nr:protein ALP1-like isoform X2 [Drosophila pseudoobscura]